MARGWPSAGSGNDPPRAVALKVKTTMRVVVCPSPKVRPLEEEKAGNAFTEP